MTVVGLVVDLMDRSRFPSGTTFVRRAERLAEAAGAAGATVVAVDLSRPGAVDAVAAVRSAVPGARIVAFGSHVDRDALAAARAAGADRALARSAFFADVAGALARPTGA